MFGQKKSPTSSSPSPAPAPASSDLRDMLYEECKSALPALKDKIEESLKVLAEECVTDLSTARLLAPEVILGMKICAPIKSALLRYLQQPAKPNEEAAKMDKAHVERPIIEDEQFTNEHLIRKWSADVKSVQEKIARIPLPHSEDNYKEILDMLVRDIYKHYIFVGRPPAEDVDVGDLASLAKKVKADSYEVGLPALQDPDILCTTRNVEHGLRWIVDLRLVFASFCGGGIYEQEPAPPMNFFNFQKAKIGGKNLEQFLTKANRDPTDAPFTIDGWEANHCNFFDADLSNVVFENIKASRSSFEVVNASETMWFDCSLQKSNFRNVDATSVVFLRCSLQNCEFINSKMVEVIFSDSSDASHCRFDSATVDNADVSGMKAAFRLDLTIRKKDISGSGGWCSNAVDCLKHSATSALRQLGEDASDDEEDSESGEDDQGEDDSESEEDAYWKANPLFGSTQQISPLEGPLEELLPPGSSIESMLQASLMSSAEDMKPTLERLVERGAKTLDAKMEETQLAKSLHGASSKIVSRSKQLFKNWQLAEAAMKASLTGRLKVLDDDTLDKEAKVSSLGDCLQDMKAMMKKDLKGSVSQLIQKVDTTAFMESLMNEKLKSATGLNLKGIFTFVTTSYATTLKIKKELDRLRDSLVKLDERVSAATWLDSYEEWAIFIRNTEKLQQTAAVQVAKKLLSAKDSKYGKTILEHMGVVQLFLDIKNQEHPPDSLLGRLRAVQSILKSNFNEIIMKLDSELVALQRIQDRKVAAYSFCGTVLLSALITVGQVFANEKGDAMVQAVMNFTSFE